jgi:DNA-directed RNA polymerase specialized sigma24 family protein
MLRNYDDAKDLAQETFSKTYRKIDQEIYKLYGFTDKEIETIELQQ